MLTLAGMLAVRRCAPDRWLPWSDIARNTLGWLFPAGRLWRRRPVFSTISFTFHAGLLAVPLTLAAHILLWKGATGLAWPAISHSLSNWLTLTVILTGLALAFARALHKSTRALSRVQDFAWPVLLTGPFVTGYLCANVALSPPAYQALLVGHIYSGDLILLLIPFTKIAHCVLAPFSQAVSALSWKLAPGAGDRVAADLGYAGSPTWTEGARFSGQALHKGA